MIYQDIQTIKTLKHPFTTPPPFQAEGETEILVPGDSGKQ